MYSIRFFTTGFIKFCKLQDESLHKIREEEERRKETQAKFHSTLAEISALLQQNNEKNAKLRDDNISMTEKFKTVVQQYQMREDQVCNLRILRKKTIV